MIWLLSQLWLFGLVSLVAGFLVTWFTVVQKRTVRARLTVDRSHHAHARSGSTKAVGSSLDELAAEDGYAEEPVTRRPAPGRDEAVGIALEPRRGASKSQE